MKLLLLIEQKCQSRISDDDDDDSLYRPQKDEIFKLVLLDG